MRNTPHVLASLALPHLALTVLLLVGIALPASAQSDNPPVANCNATPDTNAGAKPPPVKITATPITAELLTSGQPCQQVVSTKGLVPADAPSSGLRNLQRGFDFYSWLTFIAMNAPADGAVIGKGPRPGGDAKTKWEDIANYRPLADVMLKDGATPQWGTRPIPEPCKGVNVGDRFIFQLIDEAFDQPFKTGPLIDQEGNFALFDILMNHPMFDFIAGHGLYSQAGQQKFGDAIEFPIGNNPGTQDGKPVDGHMGAIMLKVSYRILDPEKDKALISQFHTVDALISFPGPPVTKAGPACVEKKLGLIGFHVGHKTDFAPQWVWTSFEHVHNVPNKADIGTPRQLPWYSFFNAACKANCPALNDTPPQPWDPETSLKFAGPYRSQVVRDLILPQPVLDDVADLNRAFRAVLKGTVWENYELLATQWPSDHASLTDPNGAPAPTFLANTTLETYSQGQIPLASSSCMACHGNATTHHVPATPSDFTFILEKAQ